MNPQKQFALVFGLVCMSLVLVGAMGLTPSASISEDASTSQHATVAQFDSRITAFDDGMEVYTTRCLSCHMMNGEGVQGVFPPLANSEHVAGDKGILVRMILNGLRGEVVVNGVTYNGLMPPWGGFLDDKQVADVLTYIRSNFGNEADAVTAEEVALVREVVSERKDAWTMEELKQPENMGIPGQ